MINEIKAVLEKHKDCIPVVVTAELLAVIDGAENEVCEWKRIWGCEMIQMPHKNGYAMCDSNLKDYPCCPVCGKPIKIVEVE